jgi:hypothetical protein
MGTKMGFQDDLAREGRPQQVKRMNQSAEIKVKNWSKRWKLNGIYVICRHCGGRQKLSEAGRSFEDRHKDYCVFFKDPSQLPFGELAEILSEWRLELWSDEVDHF